MNKQEEIEEIKKKVREADEAYYMALGAKLARKTCYACDMALEAEADKTFDEAKDNYYALKAELTVIKEGK